MGQQLILSTGNPDKVKEIENIFRDFPLSIVSKKDLGLGGLEIEETGSSLEENALIKARGLGDRVEGIIIADDTGLFVEHLNDQPGINSANYGGIDHDYRANNKKLLKELEGIPLEKRQAYFETVIAIVFEDKSYKLIKGRCDGIIALQAQGEGGFGYDPLFIPQGYDKSFGELGLDVKNKISHRARALEKLKEEIYKTVKGDSSENLRNK